MIQHHKMNAVGVQPADFVIAPDVTSFDISEFTGADEMARVGEATTNETISQLRNMLGKLDSKLFPPMSDARTEKSIQQLRVAHEKKDDPRKIDSARVPRPGIVFR